MVEHAAVNRGVVGSSPTSGAIFVGSPDLVGVEPFCGYKVEQNFPTAMYCAYTLQNPRGKFYIGQTEDLAARLESHNRLDCCEGKFTAKTDLGKSSGRRSTQHELTQWRGSDKSNA